MRFNLKRVAVFELILILVLLSFLAIICFNNYSFIESNKEDFTFISPRIAAGVLEPKSFLITNYVPLKKIFESFMQENNFTASIYVENLRNGASIGINERTGYPFASLVKVLAAVLVLKMKEEGKIGLDDLIKIEDSDRTANFGTLYKTTDKELSVKVLLEKMLQESDDTAFRALSKILKPKDANFIFSYLDMYTEDSINKTKPGQDYDTGLATPKSFYNVFSSIYLSTILESQDSEYILSLLSNTVFDIKKIANLPPEVKVSQKFGVKYEGENKYLHSCGIMYIKASRIFYCIMMNDLEFEEATQAMGFFVNTIYEYVSNNMKFLDDYKKGAEQKLNKT
ncbi:serine hydrolase [Candidatus Woesearchaeota archaeon]|nr:serine hydrolase [Candidatus Woesearchaeota archaeon]